MEREMDIPPATGEGRRRPPGRSPDDDKDEAAAAAEEGDEDQPIGDERISSSSPASLP
jgi:hypothetical protein